MTPDSTRKLVEALWRIYRRPQPPAPPEGAANLPWDEPGFGERMLREHLDQSHGAASRQQGEILRIVDWLWDKLSLREDSRVLDVTCGPGLYAVELALRGCRVHGVDFSPTSIGYARRLAADEGMAECCTFELADVRAMGVPAGRFDAALFLYGQVAVFSVDEAADLLRRCAAALRPGGRLAVELLDFERVDRQDSAWWYTGDAGLWGDFPYLHLGERRWYPERDLSLERYYILNLETGGLDEYALSDQAYPVERAAGMLRGAGFAAVQVYPAWGGLELYDAGEWVVYVGEKSVSTP